MFRLEPTLEPERLVRRIEVIIGAGRRRRWTADDKAQIVEETLETGASVSVVALRHGLTPQQVFTWRREARHRSEEAGVRGGAGAKASMISVVIRAPEETS